MARTALRALFLLALSLIGLLVGVSAQERPHRAHIEFNQSSPNMAGFTRGVEAQLQSAAQTAWAMNTAEVWAILDQSVDEGLDTLAAENSERSLLMLALLQELREKYPIHSDSSDKKPQKFSSKGRVFLSTREIIHRKVNLLEAKTLEDFRTLVRMRGIWPQLQKAIALRIYLDSEQLVPALALYAEYPELLWSHKYLLDVET